MDGNQGQIIWSGTERRKGDIGWKKSKLFCDLFSRV